MSHGAGTRSTALIKSGRARQRFAILQAIFTGKPRQVREKIVENSARAGNERGDLITFFRTLIDKSVLSSGSEK